MKNKRYFFIWQLEINTPTILRRFFFRLRPCAFLTLILFSFSLSAKTVYVTDTMKHTLRNGENNRSKIITMLPSGSKLTVILENPDTGYTFARTQNGKDGYILTRHTTKKPASKWYLKKTRKELDALKIKFNTINKELEQLKAGSDEAFFSNHSLTKERDKLRSELEDLRKTASNSVQLKHQRDQLQERVVSVERELHQVKRKNQVLEDSANQDWFLYGGLLSLFGVLLGFILPKLSWPRKSNHWDTF